MSKKVKKSNRNNRDIIVVLFVFAVLILAAAAMTMCGRDDVSIGSKEASRSTGSDDTAGKEEIVIIATVGVAVVIAVCFTIKKVNETKRRNEAIRLHNQRLEDERRLAEAKERVRQARLQEMIDAGINQLTEKRSGRGRGAGNTNTRTTDYRHRKWDDDFDSYDVNDRRLDAYYRNKYDDDELYGDDDDLYDDEYEMEEVPDTLIGKIRYKLDEINSYWWIIAIVLVVAVIGGVIIALNVL